MRAAGNRHLMPMDKQTLKQFLAASSVATICVLGLGGCGLMNRHKTNTNLPGPVAAGDQPDKILYERAMNEIEHARYDVGRLTLQTLLNTYPDSEFLAKAKLAIADSYYNEGGISGLTQSESEYKDFITFFPTAPEAPEAQFRAAMAHFRLMNKPDRDRTEARLAEAEFKEFLLKYPDSKIMPRAKARLREVQEVLGASDYKIAQYYYMKEANRAARSRFQEIADRYPNFSQADSALWYLGQTLERLKTPKEAAGYYAELITDYPISPLVDDARDRLKSMHEPIPHATRAMIARARADESHRHHLDLVGKVGGMLSSTPNVSATRHGPVRLGEKPAAVEAAKTQPETGGNAISVEQLGDSSLKPDKPAETKSESADASPKTTPDVQGKEKTVQATSGSAKPDTNNTPAEPIPTRKKRFHFIRRMIP